MVTIILLLTGRHLRIFWSKEAARDGGGRIFLHCVLLRANRQRQDTHFNWTTRIGEFIYIYNKFVYIFFSHNKVTGPTTHALGGKRPPYPYLLYYLIRGSILVSIKSLLLICIVIKLISTHSFCLDLFPFIWSRPFWSLFSKTDYPGSSVVLIAAFADFY